MTDTTDRELLELAAKAAGLPDYSYVGENDGMKSPPRETRYGPAHAYWNPLEDDGDALRLAVILNIEIGWEDEGSVVFADNCSEPAEENPAAATRRAVVRAAASLAKEQS